MCIDLHTLMMARRRRLRRKPRDRINGTKRLRTSLENATRQSLSAICHHWKLRKRALTLFSIAGLFRGMRDLESFVVASPRNRRMLPKANSNSLDTQYVQQAFLEAALRSNSLRRRIASLAGYVWPETGELRAGKQLRRQGVPTKNPLSPFWSQSADV
jgi:hypothetical protein